jgi:hypothetical protein
MLQTRATFETFPMSNEKSKTTFICALFKVGHIKVSSDFDSDTWKCFKSGGENPKPFLRAKV